MRSRKANKRGAGFAKTVRSREAKVLSLIYESYVVFISASHTCEIHKYIFNFDLWGENRSTWLVFGMDVPLDAVSRS